MPNPFQPVGATANLAVTASAQAFALPVPSSAAAPYQYVLTVIGSQPVFVLTGGGAATVNNAMPLLAGSQVAVTFDATVTSVSVIAPAAGSTLYATAGYGE